MVALTAGLGPTAPCVTGGIVRAVSTYPKSYVPWAGEGDRGADGPDCFCIFACLLIYAFEGMGKSSFNVFQPPSISFLGQVAQTLNSSGCVASYLAKCFTLTNSGLIVCDIDV